MDVGSFISGLTGQAKVHIDIQLKSPHEGAKAVPITHLPSWKLQKNPFWRVGQQQKRLAAVAPEPMMMPQQQQQMNPNSMGQQQQQQQYPSMQQQQLQQQPGMMSPGGGMMGHNPGMMNQGGMQQNPGMMQQNPGMMQQNPGMMQPNAASMMQSNPGMMQQNHPNNNMMTMPGGAPPNTMMMNNRMGMMPQQQQQVGINHYNLPMSYGQKQSSQIYAYEASEDVEGIVILHVPPTAAHKGVEHLGISVQFIGRIDMSSGSHEGRPHYDFVSLKKELAPPGMLVQTEAVIPFTFKNIDKELESYRGRNVSVKYLVRVKMERKFFPPITHDHEVWVQVLRPAPTRPESIKMEVGIEECLHIEFEYDRRHYHLNDTIRGKIRFMLVSIKLKHMELAVLRRETSGEGVAAAAAASSGGEASNIFTETQTLVKYEIMDGAPVKGEVIPVKLCLDGIPADLTPTFAPTNNRFSVRYYLNLVLVDDDDRRYFKQQEIVLWRQTLG